MILPGNNEVGYCDACETTVRLIRPIVGRAVGVVGPALALQLFGKRQARSVWGTLFAAGVGLIAGLLVDRALGAACAECGATVRASNMNLA